MGLSWEKGSAPAAEARRQAEGAANVRQAVLAQEESAIGASTLRGATSAVQGWPSKRMVSSEMKRQREPQEKPEAPPVVETPLFRAPANVPGKRIKDLMKCFEPGTSVAPMGASARAPMGASSRRHGRVQASSVARHRFLESECGASEKTCEAVSKDSLTVMSHGSCCRYSTTN